MKPLPWSFSGLSAVETCPKQYHEVKVLKRWKEKPHDANDWGIRAHKALEDACAGRRPLDPEMSYFQPLVDMVEGWRKDRTDDDAAVYLEKKLGITKDLEACDFFDKEVWGRGVLDILRILPGGERAIIMDWKTGKRKLSMQMIFCALLVFINYPKVKLIRTNFVWLKDGKQDPEVFAREDMPVMWQRVMPMLSEYRDCFKNDRWIERPSGLCKGWCAVEDCAHWSKKK